MTLAPRCRSSSPQSFKLGRAADSITVGLSDLSTAVTGGRKGNTWSVRVEVKVSGQWLDLGATTSADTKPRSRPVLVACFPGAEDWNVEVIYAGAAPTSPVEVLCCIGASTNCTTAGLTTF